MKPLPLTLPAMTLTTLRESGESTLEINDGELRFVEAFLFGGKAARLVAGQIVAMADDPAEIGDETDLDAGRESRYALLYRRNGTWTDKLYRIVASKGFRRTPIGFRR